MPIVFRRQFLASTSIAGLASVAPSLLLTSAPAYAAPATTVRAGTRVIEVGGRAATVFALTQPDATHGLVAEAGRRFRVKLENQLDEQTLIHWHGFTPPWQQDGVPASRGSTSTASALPARCATPCWCPRAAA